MKKIVLTGLVLFSTLYVQAGGLKKKDSQKTHVSESAAKKSRSGGADFLVGGDLGLSVPLGGGARNIAGPGIHVGIAAEYFLFDKLGLGNSAIKNISVTANLNDNLFAKKTYHYNGTAYADYKLNITTFSIGANYHFINPETSGLGLYVGLGLTANQYSVGYDTYDNNGFGNGNTSTSGTYVGIMPRFGLQYGFNDNWVFNAQIGTNLILGSGSYYGAGYYGGPTGSLSYMPLSVGIRYRFKL